MRRLTYLGLALCLGLVLISLPGFRLAQSQEEALTEIEQIEKQLRESRDVSTNIPDFAPETPGHLVDGRCYVQNLTQNKAVLAFERPGVLDYIELREGDVAEIGTVVGHLKDDAARAQHAINQKEAQNTVDERYARKAYAVAVTKLQKTESVNEKIRGTVPEIEIEELRLDAQRAELQIEQAEHKQEIARLTAEESAVQLKMYDLKAPFTGTVTKVYKSKGEAVNQGDPVLEILNIDTVRVHGAVSREIAQQLHRGDRVLVQLLLSDRENDYTGRDVVLEGKIQFVDLKTLGVEGKVKIYADVTNRDNMLLPGSAVAMKIVTGN